MQKLNLAMATKTTRLNQGLVMGLAIDAGYKGTHSKETEAALRERLKKSGAFTPK